MGDLLDGLVIKSLMVATAEAHPGARTYTRGLDLAHSRHKALPTIIAVIAVAIIRAPKRRAS